MLDNTPDPYQFTSGRTYAKNEVARLAVRSRWILVRGRRPNGPPGSSSSQLHQEQVNPRPRSGAMGLVAHTGSWHVGEIVSIDRGWSSFVLTLAPNSLPAFFWGNQRALHGAWQVYMTAAPLAPCNARFVLDPHDAFSNRTW